MNNTEQDKYIKNANTSDHNGKPYTRARQCKIITPTNYGKILNLLEITKMKKAEKQMKNILSDLSVSRQIQSVI